MADKRRVTLIDVAAAAGVSKMTASRALRRAADVSAVNVDKVHRAALDIGYVGNHAASALSGQRSPLIGVIVPSIENKVFGEVFSGIADALEGTGLQPFFGVTDYSAEKEMQIIREMLSWNPSGIILTGIDQPDSTRALLKTADVPVVQMMDTDGTPIGGCVGFSHRTAGEEMATVLVETGCKRIGYVGCGLELDLRAQKRLSGFEDALAQQGLELHARKTDAGLSSISKGRALAAGLLNDFPKVDCIYFSNDDLATGGAFHCIAENIEVGSKLVLAGFNGLDILTDLPVQVATTITPRREIGAAAVKMVLNHSHDAERNITLIPSVTLGMGF